MKYPKNTIEEVYVDDHTHKANRIKIRGWRRAQIIKKFKSGDVYEVMPLFNGDFNASPYERYICVPESQIRKAE